MSWNEILNSISKLMNGEGDIKSIATIIIVIAIISLTTAAPSIILKMMEARQRRHYEKVTDRSMIGWIKYGKKEKNYIDMLLQQYAVWTIILLSCLLLHLLFYVNLGKLWARIISMVVHLVCSFIYGKFLWKNDKIRECIKIKKKKKIIASVFLYVILFVILYGTMAAVFTNLPMGIFWIMLIGWIIFIMSDWESKYTYENKYTIVNTKEFGTIENVQAWNIKNYNGWISLFVCENGETQERRIKKEDIIGATYYGKPVVVTSNVKFFTTYNTLVEDQK